jgi:hypothetical protein
VPPPIEAAPLPQPAPAPAPVGVASPLVGIAPAFVAAPAGLQLAVIGGGVRLPTFDVAQAAPVDERPIARAGSEAGESAFLPAKVKPAAPKGPAPAVPVYPRKQARH